MVIPVIFQIIDECANIEAMIQNLSEHYKILFNTDTRLSGALLNTILTLRVWKRTIKKLHIGVLVGVVLISLIYSDLNTVGEILFYYYAAIRIMQLGYI
jgi:hypothetical protein